MTKLRQFVLMPTLWSYGVGPVLILYAVSLMAYGVFRVEHGLLLGGMLVANYVPKLRPYFQGMFPFCLFGVVYDGLRFVTPVMHARIPPHVAGPYHIEMLLFGLSQDGKAVTPPEALAHVYSAPLLLLCGFAYFFFIHEVFLFGFYLLFTQRDLLRRFGWGFFLLCAMGFATWYLYPAAPPWYVVKYGMGPADLTVSGDPARLVEVDAILGIEFFAGFYRRSTNVFGAVPSLHAAFPLMVWLYVRKSALARYHWGFFAFWLLMCFSAVYLGHHYVIDVALGMVYALVAYGVAEELLHRRWPKPLALQPTECYSPENGSGIVTREGV